jgi:tRNA(Ile)-lysidine synthase TilS/MesJ
MHDETNDSADHTRNSIRRELVPLLEKFNPGIRRVLVNLAESAAGDAAIVQETANAMLDAITRASDSVESSIDRVAWCKLAHSWQRAVLRAAIARDGALVDVRFAAIEEARHVLNSDAARARIDLTAGVWIAMERDGFCIQHGAKIDNGPTQ